MEKKITRSPNYPGINLEDAIERIGAIYESIHRHSADRETIARTLGYGGLNGISRTVISALLKYNLLEEVTDENELRVSTIALDILLYQPGSPERTEAIKSIAFAPKIFQDLYAKYGIRLPNDETIRAYLIKNDFNPKTVPSFIQIFRDTIEFAKKEGALVGREDEKQAVINNETHSKPHQLPAKGAYEVASFAVQTHNPLVLQAEKWGEKELKFQISSDCEARVEFRGQVTQEAIEKLSKFLELSKDSFPSSKTLNEQILTKMLLSPPVEEVQE